MIITFSDSSRGRLWDGQKWRKEAHIRTEGSCWQIPHFRKSPSLAYAWYVSSKNYFMWKKEITLSLSGVVGLVLPLVVEKKIAIFEIQISRNWLYRWNDPNLGPSKFRSWWCISMTLSPWDPRCWWSMHIYIGYFHPKYNFHISNINWTYEISSPIVYFYRTR